nr:RHS repeat-associated core domain-containing protein [Hyphomonas sp.]
TTGWLASVRDPLGNTTTFGYDNGGSVTTVTRPGSVVQRMQYTLDGEIARDSIRRGVVVDRAVTYTRDVAGRITLAGNRVWARDTVASTYSPFGHLIATTIRGQGLNYQKATAVSRTVESYKLDALGNLRSGVMAIEGTAPGWAATTTTTRSWSYPDSAMGRLVQSFGNETHTYEYDLDGNTVFVQGSARSGRADFYDAAGKLVASDWRAGVAGSQMSAPLGASPADSAASPSNAQPLFIPEGGGSGGSIHFSEHRYDALGRRVWVRIRRDCNSDDQFACGLGIVRRTIWQGDQELAEIQQPGDDTVSTSTLENDGTASVRRSKSAIPGFVEDANTFFGAVLYVHSGALDTPLALLRLHYRQLVNPINNDLWTTRRFGPFAVYPQWRMHGEADRVTTGIGDTTWTEGGLRVSTLQQPGGWTPYMQQRYFRLGWHGTLLENKRDQRALVYRRNRYVDPTAGRFTQEDPIGLAGGLNAYGFAAGDPLTYSDPFGLWPCPELCAGIAVAGGGALSSAVGGAGSLTAGISGAAAGPLVAAVGVGVAYWAGLPVKPTTIRQVKGAAALRDATAVTGPLLNRSEEREIRSAIKSVTGKPATDPQYDCMSEEMHAYKESGDGGTKNKKGDYTWDELITLARQLFGRGP